MPNAQTSFGTDIPARISADPAKAKDIGAIFLFNITGDGGGSWTVNLKDEVGVVEGDAGNADCTIECTGDTWQTLSDDPSQAMPLFMAQKISASNPMLAIKLQDILG